MTLALVHAVVRADDGVQPTVTFRFGPLTQELVTVVSEKGKSETVRLLEGTDVLAEVATRCGKDNASGYYFFLFLNRNKHVVQWAGDGPVAADLVLRQPETITFPACVFSESETGSVPVSALGPNWQRCILATSGEPCKPSLLLNSNRLDTGSIGSVYARQMGIDFELVGEMAIKGIDSARLKDLEVARPIHALMNLAATFDATSRDSTNVSLGDRAKSEATRLRSAILEQDIRLANARAPNFRRLPQGHPVLIPVRQPKVASVSVSPADVAEFAAAIGNIVDEKDSVIASTIRPMAAVRTSDSSTECDPTMPSGMNAANWPFNLSKVEEILRLTADDTENGLDTLGRVLVMDTGLPDKAPQTGLLSTLLLNAHQQPAPTFVLRMARRNGTSYGDAFYPSVRNGDHGFSVASIVAGGSETTQQTLIMATGGRTRFIYAGNIYWEENAQLQSSDDSIKHSFSSGEIDMFNIDIVNMSLIYRHESGARDTFLFIDESKEILFVFAAGNNEKGGDEIDEYVQPAGASGDHRFNTITVSAIQPNGNLANFSNFSASVVDIAAPGCRVPTYIWSGATDAPAAASLSGTSFAAPLVSLTASLLKRHKVSSPSAIKQRILAYGDYKPSLSGKVWTGNALNMAKALSTRFDFVEDENGNLEFGRVSNLLAEISLCDKTVNTSHLLSLVITDDQPKAIRLYEVPTDRKKVLKVRQCTLGMDQFDNVDFTPIYLREGRRVFGTTRRLNRTNTRHLGLCRGALCVRGHEIAPAEQLMR
jgi:hypothetical protein